ncbi:hypothetical protein M0R45_014558 [Rubus argutus]|uniref:Uncharacterized protein n=1 Tax=Rubus argutus TaxID=59490 RepID=A0AAW1XN59_RUBAR
MDAHGCGSVEAVTMATREDDGDLGWVGIPSWARGRDRRRWRTGGMTLWQGAAADLKRAQHGCACSGVVDEWNIFGFEGKRGFKVGRWIVVWF